MTKPNAQCNVIQELYSTLKLWFPNMTTEELRDTHPERVKIIVQKLRAKQNACNSRDYKRYAAQITMILENANIRKRFYNKHYQEQLNELPETNHLYRLQFTPYTTKSFFLPKYKHTIPHLPYKNYHTYRTSSTTHRTTTTNSNSSASAEIANAHAIDSAILYTTST